MSDIKQYKVISASNLEELEQKVNEQIDSGSYPLGGVQITSSEQYGFGCFQAMMLPDDEFDFYEDKLREENAK